jgi:hypothetical protein
VIAIVAAVVGCEGDDLSGLETLTLPSTDTDGSVIAAWSQPYVGRLTVDYGLTNRSAAPTGFTLRAQASTSGDPDDEACERLEREAGRIVAAISDDGDDTTTPEPTAPLTVVRDFADVIAVELPGDRQAGWIGLRVPADGEFILRSDVVVDLTIRADDGTEILPLASASTPTCSAVATEQRWNLEATTWRLRIETTDPRPVRLWIEQACPDLRTVPATCPGAASPIVEEPLPDSIVDGGFISGRIHDADLGIGDRVVIELACADTPGCAADLELFFVVTPLDCRTDNDCANAEACTEDAWCIRESNGCATAGAHSPSLWPLIGGAACLTRRRRRRT